MKYNRTDQKTINIGNIRKKDLLYTGRLSARNGRETERFRCTKLKCIFMIYHIWMLPGEIRSVKAVVQDSVSYSGTQNSEKKSTKFTIMNQDTVRENLADLA